MSSNVFRKAAGSTVVGVLWRAAVFVVVALCFLALLALREWHTSYAPSEAWADAVLGEQLEWSPVVSEAAKLMSKPKETSEGILPPPQPYPSEESFYKALSSYINDEDVTLPLASADDPGLLEYRDLLKRRRTTLDALREFWQKSVELIQTNESIARLDRRIKELKEKEPNDEAAIATASDDLENQRSRKDAILTYMGELRSERALVEVGFQRLVTDLDASIKAKEEDIREAFDAASPSARPVNGIPKFFHKFVIRIGDETHPLHVLYLLAWYGLEAAIVILLCLVLIPWLLRFGRDTDPESQKSAIKEKIKALLANAFGRGVASGAAKALAVAAVGGITLAGVTMAAGNQPSIAQVILHESEGVAGEKGGQGKPGEPGRDGKDGRDSADGKDGNPGAPGGPGQRGEKGDTGEIPASLLALLSRQEGLINDLKTQLGLLSEKTEKTREDVRVLTHEAQQVAGNVSDLASGTGTLTQSVSTLTDSIDGLTDASRSILYASNTANAQLSESLKRLQGTAATKEDIQDVKDTFSQAAKDVQPLGADLLQIATVPDTALTRVNPFHRYRVTQDVKNTLDRAMQDIDEPRKQKILDVLEDLRTAKSEDKDKRVWSFRDELHAACGRAKCDQDAQDLLGQLMPLIVKVSRVRE